MHKLQFKNAFRDAARFVARYKRALKSGRCATAYDEYGQAVRAVAEAWAHFEGAYSHGPASDTRSHARTQYRKDAALGKLDTVLRKHSWDFVDRCIVKKAR